MKIVLHKSFKIFSTWLLLIVILLFNNIYIVKANNDPTNYPYKDSKKGLVDEWSFYTRNCTSYAAYRADLIVGDFSNNMIGPNGKEGHFGNAHNWNDNAIFIGFYVVAQPVVGSVVVWEGNKGGAGPVGHVAYVEVVNSDNTYNLSEYNWNGGDGNYNYRSNQPLVDNPKFIIFSDELPCIPPASGTWNITSSCVLSGQVSAPGDVIIDNNSEVTIGENAGLNIDFINHKILIKSGSKVVIDSTAKLY